MKKTLCIWMVLIGCVLLLMIPAFAEETSGSCGDGVTWSYDQNTATLTISGTGAVDDYGDPGYSISTHAPWNHIRGQIKKLVVENGVTYLGKFSTINMMSLREVYLADTVTELTPRQFENCPKLEKVELSQNLTTIGGSAFRSCTALKELHLPDSVEDVGSFAFAKCSSLEKITLPAGLTTIWDRLFLDCTSLRSVKIPAGVNVIWTDAFSGCKSLKSVELPDGLDKIMSGSFYGCNTLLGVRIPASVTSICSMAFSGCTLMREMVFMGDMPSFEYYVFMGCSATLYYPAGNSTWLNLDKAKIECYVAQPLENVSDHELPKEGDPLEGPCGPSATFRLYKGELTIKGTGVVDACPWRVLGDSITKVTISEGITSLNCAAFADTTNLKQIKLPDSLQYIANWAFLKSAITSITIPEGVTEVGDMVFEDCKNIKRIVFPASLTKIGAAVFASCEKLNEIVFLGEPPVFKKELQEKTFAGYEGCVFVAKWNTWSDKNVEHAGGKLTLVAGEGGTSGKCGDNATWKVEGDVLTISGTGKTWNFTASPKAPWNYYQKSIKKVVVCDGITELGDRTFNELSALEEAELADSVVALASEVFRFCTSLKSVKLSNQLQTIGRAALLGCKSLEQITLPDSLKTIDNEGLAVCENLKEISIPRNVKTIGPHAFIYCTSLEAIHFEGDAPQINKTAFDDITVTVTYPWLNTTWTNEMLNQYGGKVTWQHRECKEDHSFREWERISDPTMENTGLEQRVCSNCGLVDSKEIPKLSDPNAPTVQTTTQPTASRQPDNTTQNTIDMTMNQPQPMFSDRAILVSGVIIGVFVLCSVGIFIRIAVLSCRCKKEKENEE